MKFESANTAGLPKQKKGNVYAVKKNTGTFEESASVEDNPAEYG